MILKRNKKENRIKLKLLGWYKRNARELPWRKIKNKNLPNPYYILVSEFMLQQTTVNTVIPRFNEFINIWPSLKDLSNTSESKILKFWSGLGYYARAKNLLKTAKLIEKKYNSKISKDYNNLIQLPGIGDYTAKAILSIAYDKPVIPIDANIKRIISRIYGINKSNKDLLSKVDKFSNILHSKNISNFIQSLMDYGSLICLPNKPKCEKCIIKNDCLAFKKKNY